MVSVEPPPRGGQTCRKGQRGPRFSLSPVWGPCPRGSSRADGHRGRHAHGSRAGLAWVPQPHSLLALRLRPCTLGDSGLPSWPSPGDRPAGWPRAADPDPSAGVPSPASCYRPGLGDFWSRAAAPSVSPALGPPRLCPGLRPPAPSLPAARTLRSGPRACPAGAGEAAASAHDLHATLRVRSPEDPFPPAAEFLPLR